MDTDTNSQTTSTTGNDSNPPLQTTHTMGPPTFPSFIQSHEITPSLSPSPLPDSVRGAPEALKSAIRKKQNKESARRSRRRRKDLVSELTHTVDLLMGRYAELEHRVAHVETFLDSIGFHKVKSCLTESGNAALRDPTPCIEEDIQRLIERCVGKL